MQKMVIPSPTQSKDSEIGGHSGMVIVVLHCRKSVINWLSVAVYQLAMPCVCPDLINHITFKQLYVGVILSDHSLDCY